METWRSVIGWAGYEASDLGRVRVASHGKILSHHADKNGYRLVAVVPRGGRKTQRGVHRMVAAAFMGECPKDMEVNHKNGDKTDNRLVNLQYVTHKENIHHARTVLGIRTAIACGKLHFRAISPNVEAIRTMRAAGATVEEIATKCGHNKALIYSVLRGSHWSVKKGNAPL